MQNDSPPHTLHRKVCYPCFSAQRAISLFMQLICDCFFPLLMFDCTLILTKNQRSRQKSDHSLAFSSIEFGFSKGTETERNRFLTPLCLLLKLYLNSSKADFRAKMMVTVLSAQIPSGLRRLPLSFPNTFIFICICIEGLCRVNFTSIIDKSTKSVV